MPQRPHNGGLRRHIPLLLLLLFSFFVFFFGLGRRSLWEPDEGRYAEISREMLESGDWLTPRLNYLKHFDKPPITYYLIAGSFALFGENEPAGRLPMAAAGLLAVLAVFMLSRTMFGFRSGLLSALVLATSLGYIQLSRILTADIIFTFFCTLSYLFFARRRYLLFYIAMALGFMTKGPVVFIITLIPILAFLIYTRGLKALSELRTMRGILLFAVIALPWYIYEALLNNGLFTDWVFGQTLHRISHESAQPFYFFIVAFIYLFFPWTSFFIAGVKRFVSFGRGGAGAESADTKGRAPLLVFLWLALPFIFFSFIGKKLVTYILPLLVPAAIITGRLWDEAFDAAGAAADKMLGAAYRAFLLALGAVFTASAAFLFLRLDDKLGTDAVRLNVIIVMIVSLGGMAAGYFAFNARKTKMLFSAIAVVSIFFSVSAIDALPRLEPVIDKAVRPLAIEIKKAIKGEDMVVNYGCFLKSLPFYLGRRTIVDARKANLSYEDNIEEAERYIVRDREDLFRLLSSKGVTVYCITYKRDFDDIRKAYPRPLYILKKKGRYILFTTAPTPS